jgi:type I restriction enzyme S subunit
MTSGYKQTDPSTGSEGKWETPENWEVSTIGENSTWMSGGTPRRNNAEFWRGTIPWISGSTLKSAEISTSDQFLTAEAISTGSKMAPVDSTLLLVRGSALHNEIRAGLVVLPVAFNQDVKALVPNVTVAPKFLTYYILAQSDALLKLVSSAGNSAGVLDTKLVQNFKFLKPPFLEQRTIVAALSDTDALIESLEQLIAKKRHLKQGTMQELLTGKKRLPGFSGEWEVKCIGAVLTLAHGKSQHGVTDRNGIYPILATGGQIGAANRFLYDKPSVLIGRKGTINRPQYMDQPFWTVDTLFYSVIHEPNKAKYLFYQFCLIDWKQHNEASGVPSLNARTIERIELMVPPPAEQSAIATILSDMDTEIAALESKLAKTRSLKQGMMHNLLTGKIRLI